MLSALRKAAIASIASLTIALTLGAVSGPAVARAGGGGGGTFHGGGGSFGGGGATAFHGGGAGGGFHSDRGDGFRRGADFAEGRRDRRFDRDRDDGFRRFGLVGPLGVAGAYGGYSAYYPYDYGGTDYNYNDEGNCVVYRAVLDRYGHYLGRRRVVIC